MNGFESQDELLAKLEESFNKWKKEAKFNASLEELDQIFFIKDYVLASKFVSPKISRMICARIRDTVYSWVQQIHSWLIPTPYSLVSVSENQIFNDAEKEELNLILKEFMAFVSLNTVIGLSRDVKKEAEYVDYSLTLWKKYLSKLIKFSNKIYDYWKASTKLEK